MSPRAHRDASARASTVPDVSPVGCAHKPLSRGRFRRENRDRDLDRRRRCERWLHDVTTFTRLRAFSLQSRPRNQDAVQESGAASEIRPTARGGQNRAGHVRGVESRNRIQAPPRACSSTSQDSKEVEREIEGDKTKSYDAEGWEETLGGVAVSYSLRNATAGEVRTASAVKPGAIRRGRIA